MEYILKSKIQVLKQSQESDEECKERVALILTEFMTHGGNLMQDKLLQHGIKILKLDLEEDKHAN